MTPANDLVRSVRDRMPVILPPEKGRCVRHPEIWMDVIREMD